MKDLRQVQVVANLLKLEEEGCRYLLEVKILVKNH
jgi:hypothetical protein